MENIELDSWDEFPNTIRLIRERYGERLSKPSEHDPIRLPNEILFRGQADSRWKLKTTLEQVSSEIFSVQSYLKRADLCVNEIESITGKRWCLKSYPDIEKEIKECQDFMHTHLPHYDYLVYLRQHGFPSPLLDWTKSPYIAAYFAYEQPNAADRCVVYAFIETPDGIKEGCSGASRIQSYGPYVTTDARHFAQKSHYTVATSWDEDENNRAFCPHEQVTAGSNLDSQVITQDVLIRITIPRSDRIIALKQLEEYNINHYTLFQTEDALIRTMGLRVFDERSQ